MKKNDAVLLGITTFLCLLPVVLSILLYPELPDQIAVHWNSAGQPDNYLPKAAAAFVLPLFFTIVNLISKLRLFHDPKYQSMAGAMRLLSIWTAPALSLIFVPLTLFLAVGMPVSFMQFTPLLMGVVLIICGNYLPKSRQNYSVGIKLPWTLHSKENWNRTHRLAGRLWMAGGILVIAEAFIFHDNHIFNAYFMIAVVAVLVLVPMLYSLVLYRKERN